MKPRSLLWPFALLAGAWLAFAIYVWLSAGQLPERVATHFGANGMPNGWQTHTGYLEFTLLFGAGVPAFILGTFVLIRRMNGWGLNIPHKDYWLAPERRQETFDFVQRQGVWLALQLIALFTAMHYSIVAANAHAPARLPMEFAVFTGAFLIATIVWGTKFIAHFSRKPL
jgi:serine/threonine-protein kinase